MIQNLMYFQVFRDLDRGLIKDFIPEFIIGREPFGIGLEERLLTREDILCLSNNKVRLFNGFQKEVGVHRGHVISEIYREIDILKEYGLK